MSVPTVALNEDSPAGSAYIRGGDDRIREYKLQVREILQVDHYFPSSGQSDACGRHKRITLMEAADIGAVHGTWDGTESIVFLGAQTEAGKPELCYRDEDDTDVILTAVGKIALQNSRLPNNTYLIARNQAGAANVNMFKVNASDIIEFATFPITPSAAPDANYEVANKKYVDDEVAGVPAQVGLGAWVDKSGSYGAQQASTDGFVMAFGNGYTTRIISIYTDGSNPPTTVRAQEGTDSGTTDLKCFTFSPVKKNDYWKVEFTGGTITVYWIPLGA